MKNPKLTKKLVFHWMKMRTFHVRIPEWVLNKLTNEAVPQ